MAREVTRQQLARRGLIGLLVVALCGVALSLRSNGTFGAAPHVVAEVQNAGGALRSGSDVKMNGVIVGKVADIGRADNGGVSIELSMSKADLGHVPKNVVARILPATVFGTTYVDLVVHGTPATDNLEAGDKIAADKTQGTLELQQALDDIDRLVKALGPAELASAIGSAAQALDGRGGLVGDTVRTVNSYLDRLNPKMPTVRRDLQQLAAATNVLDDIAPDLLSATDDALVTMNTIVTQEAAINSLITGGIDLTGKSTAFLRDNRPKLVTFINNSSALLDAVYDNRRAGITDAIAINLALGRRLPTAVREGFVRTDGILKLKPPAFYTSGQRPSYRTSSAGMTSLLGGQ